MEETVLAPGGVHGCAVACVAAPCKDAPAILGPMAACDSPELAFAGTELEAACDQPFGAPDSAYSLELRVDLEPTRGGELGADVDVAFMPDDPVLLKRIIQELQFRDSFYRYFASKCGACRVPFGE